MRKITFYFLIIFISLFAPASAQWSSSGTSVFLTTSTNFVGIGTTTPTFPLWVEGAGIVIKNPSGSARFFLNSNSSSSVSDVVFQQGSVNMWSIGAMDYPPYNRGDFKIFNYNLSKYAFFIDDISNNIGIGTTTPSVALEVVGDVIIHGRILADQMLCTTTQQFANGFSYGEIINSTFLFLIFIVVFYQFIHNWTRGVVVHKR